MISNTHTVLLLFCSRLLPLTFSSVKDMSLLSKPAQDNITKTTDSTQPPSTDRLSISEARTPTSPTGSTLSGSERQSTETSQAEETLPTTDARKVALARRHTVFVSSKEKTKSTRQDMTEEDGGIVEKEDAKGDGSVRQTQSMPHIFDSTQDGADQIQGTHT